MIVYLLVGLVGAIWPELVPGSGALGEQIDKVLPTMSPADGGILESIEGGLKSRRIANGIAGAGIAMGGLFVARRVLR